MNRTGISEAVRQAALWAGALAAAVLAGLCIYGALIGAGGAAAMFRSALLAGVWVLLAILLLCAPLIAAWLPRRGGLLAAYLGAALVLIGAMAGSDRAHRLAERWLGSSKVPLGVMVIPEGAATSTVIDDTSQQPIGKLPFHVALGRFWIDYYDGAHPDSVGPVRDYCSRLAILTDGRIVREATVSVNHPLHYGGYHFYQYSYVADAPPCTILLVVSDSGLPLVYAGFVLLCGGLVWGMWIRPAADYLRGRRKDGNQD